MALAHNGPLRGLGSPGAIQHPNRGDTHMCLHARKHTNQLPSKRSFFFCLICAKVNTHPKTAVHHNFKHPDCTQRRLTLTVVANVLKRSHNLTRGQVNILFPCFRCCDEAQSGRIFICPFSSSAKTV